MPLLASTLGLTQPEYGYVLATGVAAVLVNVWHGLNVGSARKLAKVAYPGERPRFIPPRFDPGEMSHGD